MSSKKRTTTKEQQTVTPTNPQFVTDAVQSQQQRINDFASQDPSQFVAGASPLQSQAFSLASGLGNQTANGGGAFGLFGQAANLANSAGTAGGNFVNSAALSSLPDLGPAATYNPATISGDIADIVGNLGNAATAGGASVDAGQVNVDDLERAQAASTLDNYQDFLSPYTEGVVDSSLDSFDYNRGVERAALQAQGARAGAFGGSRFGVAEGTFDAKSNLDRSLLEAGLRDQAFTRAFGFAGDDANRAQQAGLFNAGQTNDALGLNANLLNSANIASANNRTQASIANAGFKNQFSLAGLDAQLRAALADQGSLNSAGQFNAGAQNQFSLANLQAGLQNNQFNAGTLNNLNQFNAGQADTALNRQLQAAGLLGGLGTDIGNNQRANIGLLGGLGADQREIERAQLNALPTQLQFISSLNAQQPYGLFQGQDSQGTSETVQRTGALSNVLGVLGAGLSGGLFNRGNGIF